jgi:hypothetical protein
MGNSHPSQYALHSRVRLGAILARPKTGCDPTIVLLFGVSEQRSFHTFVPLGPCAVIAAKIYRSLESPCLFGKGIEDGEQNAVFPSDVDAPAWRTVRTQMAVSFFGTAINMSDCVDDYGLASRGYFAVKFNASQSTTPSLNMSRAVGFPTGQARSKVAMELGCHDPTNR